MFKLAANPTFTAVVEVFVPTAGGHVRQDFTATFRVIEDRIDGSRAHDLSTTEGSIAFFRAAAIGGEGLVDDADQPASWNDALRDRLVCVPYVRAAMARAYFGAVTKAALGN